MEEEEAVDEQDLVRNKSKFCPKRGRNAVLDTVCETLENVPLHNTTGRKSNLNKEEETAMKNLSNDCSIVIKEADKGGAVVVMDAEFYKNKVTHACLPTMNFTKKFCKMRTKRQCKK